MKVIYFDCFSGASGDMLLGALLDAGASEEAVRSSLEPLPLEGWTLSVKRTMKGPISATQVTVTHDSGAVSRRYADIKAMLGGADLAAGVKQRALETFELLARAEAKIHGAPTEDVHFHEVGGIDTVIDIVGVAAALEILQPDQVITSPIATGRGRVDSLHGPIPVPAPAVLELLKGAEIFERGTDELVTPTGAAILRAATSRFGSMPPLEITSVGYGAGARDAELPNVVRVIEGELTEDGGDKAHFLIETNLDDISPELIPYAIERLLEAGAKDAWSAPIRMKKGRHGITLSVLADEVSRRAVLDVLYRETTTLGARIRRAEKEELERHFESVTVEGHPVRVKVAIRDGEVLNASPEYEDAVKVARITGLPLKEIYRAALSKLAD